MAITFVAQTNAEAGAAKSIGATIPVGTALNDFMVAFLIAGSGDGEEAWDDDGGGSNGWTQLVNNFEATGRDTEGAIYYKKAGSSEPDPTFTIITGTGTKNLGVAIQTFRGVDTTTPFDVVYSNVGHYHHEENDNSPTPDAITTATDAAWVVLLLGGTHEWSSGSPPTNYTQRVTLEANNRNIYAATREIATAGTETPNSWAGATTVAESQSYTLALRPASAVGHAGMPINNYPLKNKFQVLVS